jgi:hypothetical protein
VCSPPCLALGFNLSVVRLLGAVLALEGLVSHTRAELLDAVDLVGLEAVQFLLLLVSACFLEAILAIGEVGAPEGRVWAA